MKNILDWIEEKKQKHEGREPRTLLAEYKPGDATTEMEQSPDSFLRPKRYDILTGLDVPAETLEDWDVSFRRPNAQGGQILNAAQIGEDRGDRTGFRNPFGRPPKHKYVDDPDFIKFQKETPGKTSTQVLKYETILAKKNKISGLKGLYEILGPDTPYTLETLKASFTLADKKITKNMSNVDKSMIKSAKRIRDIVITEVGEPKTWGELAKGYKKLESEMAYGNIKETSQKMFFDTISEAKIKKINKNLQANFYKKGPTANTIKNIYKLHNNKVLLKAIDAYAGGKIDESSLIFKTLLQGEKTNELVNAYMHLGEVYKGKYELDGISKNIKRGNRIIKSLHGARDFSGPLGNAFIRWAKLQMGKHFDDPNATYGSLTKTVRKAIKDAGIPNVAIDEIFPARTGQLTIGKGSQAYNQIIQIIDEDINKKSKRAFDGRASTRYKAIIQARKDGEWAKVNTLVDKHKADIERFYKNNPEAKGRVKLTQLNYNPKTRTFASPTEIYGKDVIPSKILKDMEKFHAKTGLSLDVGSTMTLEKTAKDLKKVAGNTKEQIKILQKLGYGKKCKASGGRVGFANAGDVGAGQMKCIMSDVEKTRADLKSSNVEVRAMARTKQRNALKLASKIPALAKVLKTGFQVGKSALTGFLNITGIGQPIAYVIEGVVEGGFYDNARRKGYSHEQAMAETLTPGLIAGRPEGVPWYGGAETLREKELYEIKGRNEFIDVENRPPIQDPEFEKVIGIKGKVKQYVDALHEQDRIYEAIGAKEQAKKEAGLAETGFDATLLPADLGAASANVQDLARSGAYRRVDQTLRPESMASQAYNTAVENRDALDQRRRTEYLEKYDPQALEHEQKSFDIYARDKEGEILYEKPQSMYKKRYKEMDEMFPDYSKEDIDYILKNMYGTSMEKLGEGYTYENIGNWFKDKDKSAYFAENFRTEKAGGGMVGIRRPSALPPTGGPVSQGLRSLYINDRDY